MCAWLCAWLSLLAVRALTDPPAHCAGDGTVLHLASLFSEDAPLPPVISFAMGTLGFLTPFIASMVRCDVPCCAAHC